MKWDRNLAQSVLPERWSAGLRAVGTLFLLAPATAFGLCDIVVQGTPSISPNPVTAGNSINVDYTIKNQGDVSAGASQTKIQIKNSSGTQITAPTFSESSISAGSSSSKSRSVTIPSGTAAGTYTCYVILDNLSQLTQSNTGNDLTPGVNFSVSAPVLQCDIVVQGTPTISPNPVTAGNSITVDYTIKNQGAGNAGTSQTKIQIKNSSGTQITAPTFSESSISAGSSSSKSRSVTIPSGTAAGTYTCYVILDNLSQLDQSNTANDLTPGVNFSVSAPVLQCDIVVQGTPTISPNPVTAGNSITVGYTVKNQGAGNAGTSQTKIQIKNSSGTQITAPTFSESAISAGSSSSQSRSVTIPSGTAAGTYTCYVILDNLGQLDQSNTANDLTPGVNFSVSAPILQCDIVVQGTPSITPNPVTAGNSVTVGYTVKNQGGGNAGTSQTKIQIKNSSGTEITAPTYSEPAITAGASLATNRSISIPSGSAAGTYTCYVILDNLSQLSQTNTANDLTPGVNFSVTAPVLQCDIVVQGTPSISPNPVTAGNSITVGYTVKNQGAGNAGTSQTKIQIKNSSGTEITAPTYSESAIAAGASIATNRSVSIASGTAAGTYTAYVILDNLSQLSQTNTANDLTPGVSFSVNSSPVAILPPPSLVSPGTSSDTGYLVNSLTPTFSWNSVSGAGCYGLYMSKEPYGSANLVYSNLSLTGTSFALPSGILQSGLKYRWQMTSFNASSVESTNASSLLYFQAPAGPSPDLIPQNLAVVPSSGMAGSNITVSFTILNQGGAAAGVSTNNIRITTSDSAVYTTDVLLFSVVLPSLPAGASTNISRAATIPAGRSAGQNHIWLTVDAGSSAGQGSSNEGNDKAHTPFLIVSALPQITVTSPNGGETVPAGSSLPISWTVGGNTANISGFWIQYSTNSGSSWTIFTYGASTARSTTWAVPSDMSSSQTRIRVFAFDASGSTIAADTSDSNFTITSGAARPVAVPDCNNNAPSSGTYVGFDGSRSTAPVGYSIASYAWDFGDGYTANVQKPFHAFTATGTRTFQVTLTVTDSGGLVSYPSTINVTVTGQALGNPPATSMSADPVNLATGNFIYDHSDLTIPGIGFPFEFRRFYNSKDSRFTGAPLGYGWTHSYNLFLSSSNGAVNIVYGDGRSETYTNSAGVYMPEAGIYKTLTTNTAGAFVLTTKEQTRYNFNPQGRLASIVDKNSNTLSVVYGAGGALSAITNSAGRVITFVNDASNRIAAIVDPLSRTNAFAYNAQGDLIGATDPRGGTTRYGYDSDHQMTNAVDPNGNQFVRNVYNMNRVVESQKDALGGNTTFSYDFVTRETIVTNALGARSLHKHDDRLRVVQITDEAGNIQNFEYDDSNNRTKVIDKNRRTTSYTYDSMGNVTSKTTAPEAGQEVGCTTTIAYDSLNNPTNRVDAKAGLTRFSFDGRGNLIKTVNPQNCTNTVTYDARGLPIAIRDANGNTLSNNYDTAGNLLSTRDALGFVRAFAYDSGGRKIIEAEPNGATNRFTYDGNNNLIQSLDPLGFTNVFTYDANNNQTLIQDAHGAQTVKFYDPKDRLVAVRDALGGVISNIYDALDRRIVTVDPRGNATRFAYDPVGNLVAVTNALGLVTRYTYDANGNQLTVMNALGQVSSNEYDVLNRLISVTDPLGHRTSYAYDELGRRTQVTDANSAATRFQYDIVGRLTNVIDAATGTVAFTYDNVGNRKTMKEPNGHVTSFTYDKLNQLTQRTEPRGWLRYTYDSVGNRTQLMDAKTNVTNYAYDLNKRLTNVSYQVGGTIVGSVAFAYDAVGNRVRMVDSLGTTTYAYDDLNRMTNCTDSAGNTVAYSYDANGNRSSMTYPGNKVVNYTFDPLNRMATVRDWLGGVTSNTYDSAGNLALVRNPNGTTARYDFDDAGRLRSLTNAIPNASVISAYNLTLDGVGNHIQSTQIDPIAPLIPTQSVSYVYDNDNRLTNATGTAFTYDVNGNMLTQGADTFAYDIENRLTNAVIGGVTNQYQYDGIGNRLRVYREGATTRYILDVNGTLAHVLAEANASGAITAYYVYGRGLISRIDTNGTATFYHYDVRGSTVALTDSGANLTDKYAYDPFGTVVNSAGTTANPFKYVGRYGVMDEGNGLAYIRARYYSSGLGRFVTKDPATGKDGDSQSLNRFIYAMNNPLRFVDSSGFSPSEGSIDLSPSRHSDNLHPSITEVEGTWLGKELLKKMFSRLQEQGMLTLSPGSRLDLGGMGFVGKKVLEFMTIEKIASKTGTEIGTNWDNPNLTRLEKAQKANDTLTLYTLIAIAAKFTYGWAIPLTAEAPSIYDYPLEQTTLGGGGGGGGAD